MEPALSAPYPPPSVCLIGLLKENSRQGFQAAGSTLQLGFEAAKYLNRVGDTTTVVRYMWLESLKAQQQNGDPTLPTAQAPPLLSKADIADLKDGGIQLAVLVGTEGLGEIAEAGTALFKVTEAGEGLSKAAKIEELTADAKKLYPKLAEKADQLHHITPKYLGGAADGPLAKIPAAYHQLITNAFRTLAPYGQAISRTTEEVTNIVKQVYSMYPLP
jgi:hypothetical protein